MSGRVSRARSSVVDYADLDSDAELDLMEQEEKHAYVIVRERERRLHTSGTAPRQKAKEHQQKRVKQVAKSTEQKWSKSRSFSLIITQPKQSSRARVKTSSIEIEAPFGSEARDSAGVLSLFVKMPVEIVVEALSFLNLRDLYAVLRSSKSFRLLLTTDFKRLLTSTRLKSNVSLPLGMKELFLVHFLYGTQCFVCKEDAEVLLIDATRTRTCKNCSKYVKSTSFEHQLSAIPNLHPDAVNLVPQISGNLGQRIFGGNYFTSDGVIYTTVQSLKKVSDELNVLESKSEQLRRPTRLNRNGHFSLAAANGTYQSVASFIQERRDWIADRSSEMECLDIAFEKDRIAEDLIVKAEESRLQQIQKGRTASMKARGFALGYKEADLESFNFSDGYSHLEGRFTSVNYSFSDEEWNETRESLIARFEECKTRREVSGGEDTQQ